MTGCWTWLKTFATGHIVTQKAWFLLFTALWFALMFAQKLRLFLGSLKY